MIKHNKMYYIVYFPFFQLKKKLFWYKLTKKQLGGIRCLTDQMLQKSGLIFPIKQRLIPLKLMVMSNFTSDTNNIPLEEREPVSINKVNFNKVMEQMGITTNFNVKNTISPDADEMSINLNIKSMTDFSPDNIVKQVPELQKLMALREALTALKGPMGNVPEFRKKLLAILSDAE